MEVHPRGADNGDERDRVVDVHALRHTFGTHLSKAGVTPRVAMKAQPVAVQGVGFHEPKQDTRFTISELVRREVLARLLTLNHEPYAEEVKTSLHDK